jgi:hypothetical protein
MMAMSAGASMVLVPSVSIWAKLNSAACSVDKLLAAVKVNNTPERILISNGLFIADSANS